MNFKDYIIDRLFFIVIYYVSSILTIIIMSLDLMIKKYQFNIRNILYAIIISTFILMSLIFLDYYRKKPFYKLINKELEGIYSFHNERDIPKVLNREQRIFSNILMRSYEHYNNTVETHKIKNKRYLDIMRKWFQQMNMSISAIKLILENQENKDTIINYESIGKEIDKLSKGIYMGIHILEINNFDIDNKKEEVELLNIVKLAIDEKEKELISNSIFIDINQEGNLKVKSNKKWLKFAISQIISNAINYTKVKDIENKSINISLHNEKGNIILQIEDNGVGIPNNDMDNIFNPFFTGENGKTASESTGIGLYLTKKILDKLGHSIELKSVEGMGTIVRIIF